MNFGVGTHSGPPDRSKKRFVLAIVINIESKGQFSVWGELELILLSRLCNTWTIEFRMACQTETEQIAEHSAEIDRTSVLRPRAGFGKC